MRYIDATDSIPGSLWGFILSTHPAQPADRTLPLSNLKRAIIFGENVKQPEENLITIRLNVAMKDLG
jgi:hypothetical protein